ncbi:MAG: glycoside hydrolase domain-containing protein, partial [Gemmatimonadaceae bacterium]
MKRRLLGISLAVAPLVAGTRTTSAAQGATDSLPRWTVAAPPAWNADSLGNHRVVVRVDEAADAVRVHIGWRRRDDAPERKNIVVTSLRSGSRIANVARVAITRESGEIVFQPAAGAGDYAVYFMPFRRTNRS